MRASMRACTCTTGSVTRTCHAKCHEHARTNLNTIYVSMSKHARTHTHTSTCAAVYAWAATHTARTIRVSPRLHIQHNSNTFKHTIVHIKSHTYMSLCGCTHNAHCTMQALARTHMPCTRMLAMEGTIHIFMRKHAHAH